MQCEKIMKSQGHRFQKFATPTSLSPASTELDSRGNHADDAPGHGAVVGASACRAAARRAAGHHASAHHAAALHAAALHAAALHAAALHAAALHTALRAAGAADAAAATHPDGGTAACDQICGWPQQQALAKLLGLVVVVGREEEKTQEEQEEQEGT